MSKQQAIYQHLTTLGLYLYRIGRTFLFSLFALYNPSVNCRHSPTCSVYAKAIITQHGVVRGGFKALKRLLSCHPFHFKKRS